MKWSAKFQRSDKAAWEHAPVLGDSSELAWCAFSTWRLSTNTDYHAASVQPIAEAHVLNVLSPP